MCQAILSNKPVSKPVKTLVLGLGNPILTDDGAGLAVAAKLKEMINREDVTVAQAELGGMNLLELFEGYDRAILIDAIVTPNGFPGTIYKLSPQSLTRCCNIESTHSLTFADSLEVGRKLGMKLPTEIIIFAIEANDVTTFSEECSSLVKSAIPACVNRIAKLIQD